jgi:hypothetical protein
MPYGDKDRYFEVNELVRVVLSSHRGPDLDSPLGRRAGQVGVVHGQSHAASVPSTANYYVMFPDGVKIIVANQQLEEV